MVRGKLKFLSYAPIVFLSAKTGDRASKLFPLIDEVAAARKRASPRRNSTAGSKKKSICSAAPRQRRVP